MQKMIYFLTTIIIVLLFTNLNTPKFVKAEGNDPVISLIGNDVIYLEVGTNFSYMDGATATDPEDGDITSNIKVNTDLDIYTVGTYFINYYVTDSNENKVTRNQKIVVYKDDLTDSVFQNDKNFPWKEGEVDEKESFESTNHDPSTTSSLTVAIMGPTTLHFEWKVNCESNYDFLNFMVDEKEIERISGVTSWETKEIILPEGLHIISWNYSKDQTGSNAVDTGYVANIRFEDEVTQTGPITVMTEDITTAVNNLDVHDNGIRFLDGNNDLAFTIVNVEGFDDPSYGDYEVIYDIEVNYLNQILMFRVKRNITVTPILTIVKEGGVYYDSLILTFSDVRVKLNGVDLVSGTEITRLGNHELEIIGDEYHKIVHFTLKKLYSFESKKYTDPVLIEKIDANIFINGKEMTEDTIINKKGMYTIEIKGEGGYIEEITLEYDNYNLEKAGLLAIPIGFFVIITLIVTYQRKKVI